MLADFQEGPFLVVVYPVPRKLSSPLDSHLCQRHHGPSSSTVVGGSGTAIGGDIQPSKTEAPSKTNSRLLRKTKKPFLENISTGLDYCNGHNQESKSQETTVDLQTNIFIIPSLLNTPTADSSAWQRHLLKMQLKA